MNLLSFSHLLISSTVGAAAPVAHPAVSTTNTKLTNRTTSHSPKTRGMWDRECDGCKNGYCYSTCYNTLHKKAWCYGTFTHWLSYQYNKCETDDDCRGDQCSACAGLCWK